MQRFERFSDNNHFNNNNFGLCPHKNSEAMKKRICSKDDNGQ